MSTAAASASRSVDKVILSVEQGEGLGARVRRSIGRPELRNFDPFLMLDFFKVKAPAGFPDHPHRGFETVTFMLPTSKGAFAHEDFAGNAGIIKAGDLQWMTAGRGIVHSELPANDELSEGLQLWVNLHSSQKLVEPRYQEHLAESIPKATANGVTATIIAGESLGVSSPVRTLTPTSYLYFEFEPNAYIQQPIDSEWNAFLFTISGSINVGGKLDADGKASGGSAVGESNTVTLKRDGDSVLLYTGDKGAKLVLISGKPLNEPIKQYGPFVMNTEQELRQAFEDYHNGRNGFENAPGWKSKIAREFYRKHRGLMNDDDEL